MQTFYCKSINAGPVVVEMERNGRRHRLLSFPSLNDALTLSGIGRGEACYVKHDGRLYTVLQDNNGSWCAYLPGNADITSQWQDSASEALQDAAQKE